jgi:uncharacterized protein GlcG (DUF336 family)
MIIFINFINEAHMITEKKLYVLQPMIDYLAASDAARAAVAKAEQIGVTINVAVLDRSGLLVAFIRMAGAPLHSQNIAIDKAYTAVSFGLPTHQWNDELKKHSEGVQKGLVAIPRLTVFGGGLPILIKGELIGSIGVSGASETQDMECARAGLAALGLDE